MTDRDWNWNWNDNWDWLRSPESGDDSQTDCESSESHEQTQAKTDESTHSQTIHRRALLQTGLVALGFTGASSGGSGVSAATAPEKFDIIWEFEHYSLDKSATAYTSSATVVNGVVYAGSPNGNLYALNAETGVKKWKFKTKGNIISSPVVKNETVYVGSSENVYAVDTQSGKKEWSFRTGGKIWSSPTVNDGTVYIGSDDGNLYALNAESGPDRVNGDNVPTWIFRTEEILRSSPVVIDETLFVGTNDGVYALRTETAGDGDEAGSKKWRYSPHTTERFNTSSPTVVDNTVYIGSDDGFLYSIDATSGTNDWTVETRGGIASAPTVSDGTVYVVTQTSFGASRNGGLYAVNKETGAKQWDLESKYNPLPYSSPTIVDDTVFVAGSLLKAVDAASGEQKYVIGGSGSSPVVVDGTLFVKDSFTTTAVDVGVTGSSEGSRVNLGTLGHHNAFAENGPTPPGGGGSSEPGLELTAQASTGPVQPGETFRIFPVVTNTGDATTDAAVYFDAATTETTHNADYYGEQFDDESHADDGGEWVFEGWRWDEDTDSGPLSPDGTREPSVEIAVQDDVSPGEYTFRMSIRSGGDELDEATATVTVNQADGEIPRVEDINGTGVEGVAIQLFGIGVYTDSKSEGRQIAQTTTNQTGGFELPTTFAETDEQLDEQLVLTAQKGDWFSSTVFDPTSINTAADYGTLTLDRQLLAGPTVVRAPNDDPFGTVTVWRSHIDENTDVFYIEVTNNNTIETDPWLILQTGTQNGPLGGDFLFSYPTDTVSILDNPVGGDADPTRSGGVQVLATHSPQTGFCCNEPFSLPDALKPSPAGFLHPMRSYTEVPLYETTKNLGRFTELEDPPSVGAGWHPITPDSTETAAEVSRQIEKGLEFPTNACDLFGVSCGIGFLLDALDGLEWVNKLLDGGRRVGRVNETPETPIVGGATPAVEFDAWRSDKPAPFGDSFEASVVYKVPVQHSDDHPTYSVQTEWGRPYNNRGQFSSTFSTASIDAEILTTVPEAEWDPGTERSLDMRLKNRSLQTQTVTEVTLSSANEIQRPTQSRQIDIDLSPGESITLPDFFRVTPTPATSGPLTVTLEAVTETGGNVSRTHVFDVSGQSLDLSFSVSPPDPSPGTTVTFDAESESGSVSGSDVSNFEWDFDADSTYEASGRTATHTFNSTGDYSVRLQATRSDDSTVTATQTVSVQEKPSSDISATRSVSSTEVSPGGEVTLTTEVSGVSGSDSVSITSSYDPALNSVPTGSVGVDDGTLSPSNIDADASPTGSTLTVSNLDTTTDSGSVTVTVTETLSVAEEAGVTHSLTGSVTTGETTVEVDPVSVSVRADGSTSVVDEYDTDNDGTISITELGRGGADFASGELSIIELGKLGAAFASSSSSSSSSGS